MKTSILHFTFESTPLVFLINVCLVFESVFLCSMFNVTLVLVRIGVVCDKPWPCSVQALLKRI